jgi:hypothetical protein
LGLSPEQQQALLTDFEQQQNVVSVPDGQPVPAAQGGLTAPRPLTTPAQEQQMQLAREANSRAEEASQRASEAAEIAKRGNAPSGFRWNANGTALEPIPGGPKPSGTVATEGERNAAGFYQRMVNANQELDNVIQGGYDPTNLKDLTTVGGKYTNSLSSPEGQQYHQAAMNWIRANLRKESGAAIGVAEAEQEYRNYFPQFGDSPEVIKQKEQNRKVVTEAMKTAAGRGLQPTQPAPSGPQPGTVQDGYRFNGGNPADPNSWERL